MDMRARPHLHVALSTYIYLHLALDSSPPHSLKNREQREEMGYRQTHMLSAQSPGRCWVTGAGPPLHSLCLGNCCRGKPSVLQ